MSNVRANTVLTHVTHVIIISVPSDYTDKKKGENYMKRTLALLLTLAMLLSMVGTVAVAADAATVTPIAEATSTVDGAGNITVKLSEGMTDFESGSVNITKKDGSTYSTSLTYDKTKKAFVGKNSSAAGGTVTYIWLSKYDSKENSDGSYDRTDNYTYYSYYTSEKLFGKLSYAYVSKDQYTEKEKDGKWITTKENRSTRSHNLSYNSEKGIITWDSNAESSKTGDEKGSTTKSVNEEKRYNYQTGVYSGKAVYEDSYTYDANGNETNHESTSKVYNEKDVMTGSGEGTTTTTYNKAKDAKTEKYQYEGKDYSSKELMRQTTKEETTREYKKVDGNFQKQSEKSEKKITNRDGILKRLETSATTYDKGSISASTNTTKIYNAYTKAMTRETVNSTKKVGEKTTRANTYTYNNDDGSLRRKNVSNYDGENWTYTYYNKDNKVAATEDKDGTWKDGSGKVIGKNEYKDGNYEWTDVWFKDRTGEIDGYSIQKKTAATDGTVTRTYQYVEDGKKMTDRKEIEKSDSYMRYEKGVLRESSNTKDGITETKNYDAKGSISSSSKYDSAKQTETYYDYADRKYREDDYNAGTYTYYDKNTGKMTHFDKSIEGGTEHYGADSKLQWTDKRFTDTKLGANVTAYYDAKGKEFARTYSKSSYDSKTQTSKSENQDLKNTWTEELAQGKATVEKVERETKNEDKSYTETSNYSKWDSENGTEKNKVTRKEVTTSKWDDDKYESKTTKDGAVTSTYESKYNDYGNSTISTSKYYDWFTGAQTSTYKTIWSGEEDDPISHSKWYDKYDNLQTYSETDNTDQWNWKHTYYADGTLNSEYWYDELDSDSEYNSSYYLDGSLGWEYTRNGDVSRSVSYNKDGSYSYWADTSNGVTNAWLYNSNGDLTGYRWNQQSGDGFSSYDYYDEAGNLVYSYMDNNEAGTETRTDPAGNKWVYDGDTGEVTLTLANKGSGWQYAVGEWFYVENGKPIQGEWKQDGGSWYYFNWEGKMVTGLLPIWKEGQDTSTTYAIDGITGALTTGGWAKLDKDGESWAYTNANGEVLTGWQNIGGQWYYFTDGWDNGHDAEYKAEAKWTQLGNRGYMATGATQIWNSDWTSKHTYFFNEDGTWDNSPGWKVAESVDVGGGEYGVEYHYYDNAGKEVTGWRVIDGDWYYFNEDGVMKNGWVKSGPNWYFMDPAKGGAMATDGWTEDIYEAWYYVDKNGNYKTGWLQDGNNWYYLKDDGSMAAKEWAKSGSDWYYMDENGAMATGWIQDKGNWYCLKSDGTMKTGWEGSGNTWYYLNADGTMAADTDVTIGGKTYHFDETGLCTNP